MPAPLTSLIRLATAATTYPFAKARRLAGSVIGRVDRELWGEAERETPDVGRSEARPPGAGIADQSGIVDDVPPADLDDAAEAELDDAPDAAELDDAPDAEELDAELDAEEDALLTPSGIPAAEPGYNPHTGEADLFQPGTEEIVEPATAKAIRSEAETMRKASDPDKS